MIYPLIGKRIFDLVVSVVSSVMAAPILAVVYVLHKLFFKEGSFLFKQRRVGLGGEPFTIYKVQTMNDAGETTKFTRLLRKTSVDELPQIFNVIKGDMSLIGPRPEMESKALEHNLTHHIRHITRPGISGRFQISPDRDGEIVDALHHDEAYVNTLSFWNDIAIMAKTIPALVASHTD